MFRVPDPAPPSPPELFVDEFEDMPGRTTVYAYADNPMVASNTTIEMTTTLFISRPDFLGFTS